MMKSKLSNRSDFEFKRSKVCYMLQRLVAKTRDKKNYVVDMPVTFSL
jgi:hypothetical protein